MKFDQPPQNIAKKDIETEETIINATPDEGVDQLMEDSEPIDMRIQNVNEIFNKHKEMNIEVTDDIANLIIEKELGISGSDLLEKEIADPQSKKLENNIAAQVKEMLADKESNESTMLNFLRDKMFKSRLSKAVVLSAILFFKFYPSFAGEQKGTPKLDNLNAKNKTEISKKTNMDGGDGDKNSYKITPEDLNKTEQKFTIKAASSFDTDKAEVKNKVELGEKFDKFFSSINSSNFEKMISHNWIFSSSSDERETSNWDKSNLKLTEARYASFLDVYKNTLAKHNFDGLAEDQVKQILEKPVDDVHPTDGVTHITDLMNPITHKCFTEKEVNSLDSKTRDKLLEKCRYANFEVESTMFAVGAFGQLILVIDDSPSMEHSKVNMANELRYINKDMPIKLGFFSSNLSTVKEASSSQEAANELSFMKMDGSGQERALTSAIQYLEHIPADDVSSKAMYVATDENLQDLNQIIKLVSLSKKTNTEVTFLMFYDNGSKFIKIGADKIFDKFKQNVESNNIVQKVRLEQNIKFLDNKINTIVDRIGSILSGYDGNLMDAYEKSLKQDGITGNVNEIKETLKNINWDKLKHFGNVTIANKHLGNDLMFAKIGIEENKSLIAEMEKPIDDQIFTSLEKNLKNPEYAESMQLNNIFKNLINFEDSKGNKVDIPTYN